MGPSKRLVTIKRSGGDGPHFPLSLSTCLFGRGIECDIRIQLPVVSKQHCKIETNEQEAILYNFSSTNPTQVNGSAIDKPVQLKHGDVITIIDRSFRYENESCQNGNKSTEFPRKIAEQGPSRRVSRSSFSSDPDGEDQDSKAHPKVTAGNVSGRPLFHVKSVRRDSSTSGGSKVNVAQETSNVHSSERPGHNGRNANDPTSGDVKEKSRVQLVSCYGELKSFSSTQCLDSSKKNDSPFRKLYQSMKEELKVKSQKENVLQYRRKSRSQTNYTTEKESANGLQRETQLLVSGQQRQKSGRSTPSEAAPASLELGPGRREGKGSDMESVPTSKEAVGSSIPLSDTTKMKTPRLYSQQLSSSQKRKSEDLYVLSGRTSVNLGNIEDFKADDKTLTPRKLLTRNQTPTNVEDAANSADKRGNLSSKNRRSIPTNAQVLPTETEIQNEPFLTLWLTEVERQIQKDSLYKLKKLDTTAGQICSDLPGLSSVDISNFGDSINKNEGGPLKRRRVSFGGHLRPELFDENLPPNTPLKKGETPTKRKSLVSHTPTVLKKIMKPQPSGKEEFASEIHVEMTAQNMFVSSPAPSPTTTPVPSAQSRRSCRASSASSGSKSQTDIPKRGGRKSGNLPSKRTSISRSQHDILQMICSKRRSGASEANLIVAKSWADVVKLGAKQTQTKVVKHSPQRPMNKKQRRPNTPRKPVGDVHNQFSTGHANSPCTIVIGKAHAEKVNVPARPYRMLSTFVSNQKLDFKEDLSGLSEMFKTPVKEKSQLMSSGPVTLSSSENLLGKKFQVTNSGEKPLLPTSESFGENVLFHTWNAAKEPDTNSASPALQLQCVKENETLVKTPRNIYKANPVEMKTSDNETEPSKTVSSANRLRGSMELRNLQKLPIESKNEDTKTDTVEDIMDQCLSRPPLREKKIEGEMKETERLFETCKEIIESKENSAMMAAGRGSRRTWGHKSEPASNPPGLKRWPETAPMKDMTDTQDLQTQDLTKEPRNEKDKTTNLYRRSLQAEPVNNPMSTNRELRASQRKVDVKEELSAVGRLAQTQGQTVHTHKDSVSTMLQETPRQKVDPENSVTGGKRWPRTAKEEVQPLEDLSGFKELFQTPKRNDKPTTEDKTTKIPSKSPQPEPVNTTRSMKRWPKTPLGKVATEEELAALRKLSQMPGESTHTPKVPGEDKDIRAFKECAEQKLDPATSVNGSRKRPRAAKEEAQSLEDLSGFKELFQMPKHNDKPTTEDKTTKIPSKSLQLEQVNTPIGTKTQSNKPVGKIATEEELAALRKLSQTPGEPTHTTKVPGEDKGIKAFKENAEQKLDPAASVTGSRRRPRAAKVEAQPLEDLAGFKELFQTPKHDKPTTEEKTTKILSKSLQSEPVNTPTSMKRWPKTPLVKIAIEEEHSALRKLSQTPGEPTHTPKVPGEDKGIRAFKESAEQKLDSAASVISSRKRPRAAKEEAQSLEDLSGFKELFQTPKHNDKPTTEDKTTKIPCTSPQPEPANTPIGMKRWPKTPLGKMTVEEELSAARKLSQTAGEPTHTPKVPGEDKGIRAFKQSAEQKLGPAASVTGSRKRPRAAEEEAQSLEDLSGFKELFQTPGHTEKSMTHGKTTRLSCTCPQPGPVATPVSMKRQPNTSLGKADVEGEFFVLRKLTPSSGKAMHTPKPLVHDEKGMRAFRGTPKHRWDLAEDLTGHKRRPRTPKEEAQALEDLSGFKELFQTPGHTEQSMTVDKSTKIPWKSLQPAASNTPTSANRPLRISQGKVDAKEELSAVGRLTQTRGQTVHTHREPVSQGKGTTMLEETPRQKVDPENSVTGGKRWPRAAKEEAQPLEDLSGFKELFQTPGHTEKSMTHGKTTRLPCTCPQPGPVATPVSMKRQPNTSLGKADVEGEFFVLRKLTPSSGKAMHTPKPLVHDEKGMRAFRGTLKHRWDLAEDLTRHKRRPRTPKEEAQGLEDLSGFKELFQTPGHTEQSMTVDKSTKTLWKSFQPAVSNTPTSMNRPLQISQGKVDMKEELSAVGRLTQTRGQTVHTHREPVSQGKGTTMLQETPRQKVDPENSVTGGKRWPRAAKEEVQSLEDLSGFKELFQTPKHNDKPTTEDKTTKISCTSPQPEPANTPIGMKRWPKTPLGKMTVEEELSAARKLSQTAGEPTHTPKVPGEDKGIRAFKQSAEQKLGPAASVTGSRKRPRAAEEEAQSLEDLSGFKELFQTPGHTEKSMTHGKTTRLSCTCPQPGPVATPVSMKRQPNTSLRKADVEGEFFVLRKLTPSSGKAMHTPKPLVHDEKGMRAFRGTPKHRWDLAEDLTGHKRRPRTPKEEAQGLEDLSGFKELFQTPGHTEQSMTIDKSTKIPWKSLQPAASNTPTSANRPLRISQGKVDAKEELSAVGRLTQTRGQTVHTHREPVSQGKGTTMLEETPRQKVDPENSVTGGKRWPRAAKEEAQPLEDLSGFKELFQTPKRNDKPTTEDKTTKIPSKSPQPEPVNTTRSMKRWPKTPLGKVATEEELAALRKLSQMPGESTHTPKVPGEDKDIRAFKECAEQKLDPATSVNGSRKRPRAAKEEAQSLEDLSDFKELFQVPKHNDKPTTEDKTTKIPSKSLQLEQVNTPIGTKTQSNKPVGKIATEEELAALRKLSQTPGEPTHTTKVPGEDKGIKAFKENAEQKLDPAASVAGSIRPRAAKEEAQPLEDLAGFKELFQTPKHDKPTTEDKTNIPSKSLQSEQVNTPIGTKTQSNKPVGKIATEEELAALRKLSQTPEEPTHTPKVPGEDKDIKTFKEYAEQKLDPAASVTGSRRRPRAAKGEAQPLEDLAGFKKLFQIPGHTQESMTVSKNTKVPCTTLQPEPVDTTVSTRRRPKTGLREVSALRKSRETSGESTHMHEVPVGEDKGIKAFKESAEQKLDPAASVTGSRRRPRAAKGEAQPLEDLAGFKKPLQTPGHTEESMTVSKNTKVPCTTLQPEPVDTTVSTRRRPKTGLREVSALRKPRETSGESTHMHEVPVGEDKGIKAFKESAEQKLDPAASVTGSRRRPRAAKEKAQPLEDLAGFRKPLQTPGHTEESMTVDKSTKMSCTSPQPEPVNTVVSTTGWPKRSLRKVSALRKLTQTSGESTHTHEVLVVEDKGINVFKQSAEQKLDLAASVTGSRRRPRAAKEKAQPQEDLAGFRKPFQTPAHTEESMTNVKNTRSPLPAPVDTTASMKGQPKGSLRKVSALQNLTQTSGKTTPTSTEPQGEDKHIRVAKQSGKQKSDPAENVNGSKRQPRAAKEEAEALEVLAHFKELVPAPGQPGESRNNAESLKTTPKHPPDSREPLKTFRRVLRVPKVQPMEDTVGTRDPIKSQSKSNTALTSKRKCRKDDSVSGTKRLRCMTATEGAVGEEPASKKQRSRPREKRTPPEPLAVVKKSLGTSAKSMEPMEDLNSNNVKTKKKEHEVEGLVIPNKGISLRPRRQNKTDTEQQKAEVPIAAEKIKIKRNEKKSVKTSQELEIENPGDGAKEPTARGKVSESRVCSRSLRQSKSSQPSTAQEEGAMEGVGTHTQNQREKGVRGNSDFMRLRSRKITIQPAVNLLESKPEQRATRAVKRCAEKPKEGKDIVYIKKTRTRSQRDSEDI
ncbi:proliferation marker protein Ki-67 isoform X2 [Lemur catta]|uniref:proliferation marker protein Ki-67 isoform X2 n=1 Tax=Lemur catta TaxID=9447 RepID=UPI001E26DA55|nr:proliferation marker protein Ki-67 isoform X2 [Lemur catta]